MDPKYLTLTFCLCQILICHSVNAHRSSSQLIIDTAKKAYERAASSGRIRRDTSSATDVKLESLLLPDPNNAHVVEFDLILDDDQYGTVKSVGENNDKPVASSRRQKRKAVRHSIYHWPGAEVPYRIDSSVDSVSNQARYRIKKAMTHWERYTCVKFVEYDRHKHRNYVIIKKGQWCASKLGMAGGPQPLYIALGCLDTGTIIHELGHSLGWVHEQARPDRDEYVSIKWSLVSANYKSQYVKHGEDFINTYDVPYDYGSIMHYPSYGELITKDPTQQSKIGQRNRLSFNDIKLANIMYRCPERASCDTKSFRCIDGGFMDHTCKCVCPEGNSKTCTVANKGYKLVTDSIPQTTTPKHEDRRHSKKLPSKGKTTVDPSKGTVTSTRPKKNRCPFEYTNTGISCVRTIDFPVRPVHIAKMECQKRLGNRLWTMSKNELKAQSLHNIVGEGEEFWIKITNYRSANIMADFFDFCPYITKLNGKLVVKDTLCYKSKGFFCQA